MRAAGSSSGWLWALALIALGVVLLLDNFLLISGFRVTTLLPLILVAAGAVVLVRGDLFAGGAGKNFGITRGSVEQAALEISAGAVDVQVYPLQKEGRLIAGQFAPDSRPSLTTEGVSARLRLDRRDTPLFAFTPWQVALARDLPWKIYITAHIGQVALDTRDLIVDGAVIGTGIGEIHFTPPAEALAPVYLRSTLGAIRITVPTGQQVRIIAQPTRLFSVRVDESRYEQVEPGVYQARDGAADRPVTTIYASSVFGDAYLM